MSSVHLKCYFPSRDLVPGGVPVDEAFMFLLTITPVTAANCGLMEYLRQDIKSVPVRRAFIIYSREAGTLTGGGEREEPT